SSPSSPASGGAYPTAPHRSHTKPAHGATGARKDQPNEELRRDPIPRCAGPHHLPRRRTHQPRNHPRPTLRPHAHLQCMALQRHHSLVPRPMDHPHRRPRHARGGEAVTITATFAIDDGSTTTELFERIRLYEATSGLTFERVRLSDPQHVDSIVHDGLWVRAIIEARP